MSLVNKIFIASLSFYMAMVSASVAQVAEPTSSGDGLIFRIENIKPVENAEGFTSQCEFYITVYNRMDRAVKEVEMNLSWKDEISAKYKVEGDKLEVETNKENARTIISQTVSMKDIAPHQQKSFKQVVDTDKCFLLFDQVEYKVDTCIAEGDDIKVKNNKRMGKGSCVNSFDYINSQNPEYYSEFKDIPESDLEQMTENEKQQEEQAINDLYKQSMETVKKISKKLHEIK